MGRILLQFILQTLSGHSTEEQNSTKHFEATQVTMGEPTVNGDMPHSATIDHVTKYPVVSDSISAFQSNPYGQKSIDITNFAYSRFVKPTFPYLEKPASYAKPYVARVDELGNTYSDEYEKCGGNGVVAGSKALVSGSFVVASDWLAYIASLLQQSKEVAKSKAAEAKAQAQEGYQEGVNAAQEKSDN